MAGIEALEAGSRSGTEDSPGPIHEMSMVEESESAISSARLEGVTVLMNSVSLVPTNEDDVSSSMSPYYLRVGSVDCASVHYAAQPALLIQPTRCMSCIYAVIAAAVTAALILIIA